MRRRDFFSHSAAAAFVPWRHFAIQPAMPLHTAPIPSTGERIARVGLGTWSTFDVGDDRTKRAELLETLRAFQRAGSSVIDTSPMYGSSESVLGDLLGPAGLTTSRFLATKVWTQGETAGIAQMNESLRKLRTDKVDLMQIHNLVDWQVHLRTLRQWKEQGRIRYLGITHYQASAADAVIRILEREPVDFLQFNLSLDEPEAAGRVLKICADRGVAFIANRPFGGGGSFGRVRGKPLPPWAAEQGIGSWAVFMLKWVLSHPEVTCAIPGTSNPRHLADNLDAARGAIPDGTTRARMAAYWKAR